MCFTALEVILLKLHLITYKTIMILAGLQFSDGFVIAIIIFSTEGVIAASAKTAPHYVICPASSEIHPTRPDSVRLS